MKKLLLIAILMLALVFTVVACNNEPVVDETTVADTTAETPTEAPDEDATTEEATTEEATTEEATTEEATTEEATTEEATTEEPTQEVTTEEVTTEEPTADPADPVLLIDPEALNTLAGAGAPNVNQIGTPEVQTEGDKTFLRLTATGGDPYVAIIPLGSDYTLPNYMAISYRTNSAVEGQFFAGSGQGWTGAGDSFMVTWTEGDWSFIVVDLTQTGVTSITDGKLTYARMDFFAGDSAEGDYFDVQYIGFFNTAEYAIAYDFEINPPYIEADDAASGKIAYSFDTFYLNNNMYFEQDGGAGDKLTAQNNTLTFAAASELQSIALRGWIGFSQPIAAFGYYVDNYEFIFGEFAQATEDAVKGAGGEHASRFQINVDLSYLEGDDHFVGFVVKLEDGTIVRLRADIIIDLPELPDDITDSFKSDVNSFDVGTNMDASDMADLFVIELPLGSEGVVANGEGKAYHLTGISNMYTDVNGRYFIKANQIGGAGFLFARGYKVVNSDEVIEKFDPAGGIYKINNYYETDSAGSYGGAGIYANVSGGNLQLVVKYYNADTVTRVGNKVYNIPCEGTELTMADDGSKVYVMVGGETLAVIELIGSKVYEDINEVQPKNGFAEKAIVTLANGTVETIENTLIADTCECQVGIVARASNFMFDSLELGGFSAIEIPEMEGGVVEPEVPAGPVLTPFNGSFHANVDHVNAKGPNGAANYQGLSASTLNSNGTAPVRKAADDGIVVNDDYTVSIGGWMAVNGGINHYAYTVNGGELIPVAAGGKDGEPLPDYYANLGMPDSTKNGLFNGAAALVADLSAYAGQTVTVAFYAIPETAQDTVAPIVVIEGLVVPAAPVVENYNVPMNTWTVSGHKAGVTAANDATHGAMVAAGGIENGALLHQGAVGVGEVDLSKYSKVIIKYGIDNSGVTQGHYDANGVNRIMLSKTDNNMTNAPADADVVASATYTLQGWKLVTIEIDLTGVDYSGPVFVAYDTLPGTFMLIGSIEFIA